MALPQFCTPEMVREMPDDGLRYETVHGKMLVTPAPRRSHQQIVRQLLRALSDYCEATGVGEALTSPADISLTPDSLVQPDVFVHPPVADRTASWEGIGRPLLVAEVVSPGTARADRFTKRLHYQRGGIPVYWIVDGEARDVAAWTPGALVPVIERAVLVWAPVEAVQPLRLPLVRLFG